MRGLGCLVICLCGVFSAGEALAGPPPPPPPAPESVTPTKPTTIDLAQPASPTPKAAPQPPSSPRSRSTSPRARPQDPFASVDMSSTTDLSKTWGYAGGDELKPNYVQTGPKAPEAAANPIGFYSGVSVGGENPPPIPPPALGTVPAVLTFPGFEPSPGGSRVFFQLSAPAQYELAQDGLVIQVRLSNTAVNVRNNRRPLDLRYFDTPVRTVSLKHDGGDTVVTVALKREAVPTTTMQSGANGYSILVLEFASTP